MSFPRAKIQRFNDIQSGTPSPADYNPKLKSHVNGAVISSVERFIEQKSPAVSDSASIQSLNNTTCFRTPTLPKKKKQIIQSTAKIKSANIFSEMESSGEALQEKIVECSNKDTYINELTEQVEDMKLHISKLQLQKEDLENEKKKFEKFLEQLEEEHKMEIINLNVKYTKELIELQNEISNTKTKLEFTQSECDKLKEDKCNELIEHMQNDQENMLTEQIIKTQNEIILIKIELNKFRISNREDIEDFLNNIDKFQKLNAILTKTYNEEIKTKEQIIHKERHIIARLENDLKQLEEIHRTEVEDIKSHYKNEVEDVEYKMLKTITDMQNRFDQEKKVFESMYNVKITNMETCHKEEMANFQTHSDLQVKRIENDFRNDNQLTKLQMEERCKDLENDWIAKLETQTKDTGKLLKECQSLNELNLMKYKEEKQDLLTNMTDQLQKVERVWQLKLEEQAKESNEILKECQSISEYNIIQCEIEKNDFKRKLSETLEELNNVKTVQNKYISEKTEVEVAYDKLKLSYDNIIFELEVVQNKLIKEKEQHIEQTQQFLSEKHTYEVTINKTRETVEALTKRLFDSDKDVEQLKLELENCEKEKLEIEDKCNKLDEELKSTKKLYEDLEYQNESNLKLSRENVQAIERKLLNKVDEYKKMVQESVMDSNLKIQEKILDAEEIKKQLHQQQVLNVEAQTLLKKVNFQLEQYEECNSTFLNKISTLSNDLETSLSDVSRLEGSNCELKKQLHEQVLCNSKLEDTLNKSCSKNQEIEMLSKQINQLQEKSDSYYHYCEYYKSKANEFEKEIEDMNEIHKKYIDQSGKYDELLQMYEKLKSRNAQLEKTVAEQESLIGPFREQLEAYEVELSTLENRKNIAENEAKMMGLKYAEILGHQNHRQKIKHLVDLKFRNTELHEDKAKLEQKVNSQSKIIEKLKKQLALLTKSPIKPKNTDKENVSLSSPLRQRN